MLVRWFLFHTRIGERVLVFLERKVGLAIVQADWLCTQHSGRPMAPREVR